MSKKIRIGFLPLTKVNWTNEAMQKQRRDAIEMLSKIPNVEIVGGEDMIETEEQSLKILERFEKDRPDMLVALFTTFALGTIVSLFAKRLKVRGEYEFALPLSLPHSVLPCARQYRRRKNFAGL